MTAARIIPPPEATSNADIGTPTTPGETVFSIIEEIRTDVGGGTGSTGGTYTATGTYAAVFQTADPTSDGTMLGTIMLDNMAGGDVVSIQVQREKSDGNWVADKTYSYSGAQTDLVLALSIPYFNGYGVRVMLRQTAGTLRTFAYRYKV